MMEPITTRDSVKIDLFCLSDVKMVIDVFKHCYDMMCLYYEKIEDIENIEANKYDRYKREANGVLCFADKATTSLERPQTFMMEKLEEKKAEKSEALILFRKAIDDVKQIMRGLPVDEKKMMIDHFIYKKSYVKMADKIGVHRNTIRNRIDRIIFSIIKNSVLGTNQQQEVASE